MSFIKIDDQIIETKLEIKADLKSLESIPHLLLFVFYYEHGIVRVINKVSFSGTHSFRTFFRIIKDKYYNRTLLTI
jgi:hypothetical protein